MIKYIAILHKHLTIDFIYNLVYNNRNGILNKAIGHA